MLQQRVSFALQNWNLVFDNRSEWNFCIFQVRLAKRRSTVVRVVFDTWGILPGMRRYKSCKSPVPWRNIEVRVVSSDRIVFSSSFWGVYVDAHIRKDWSGARKGVEIP